MKNINLVIIFMIVSNFPFIHTLKPIILICMTDGIWYFWWWYLGLILSLVNFRAKLVDIRPQPSVNWNPFLQISGSIFHLLVIGLQSITYIDKIHINKFLKSKYILIKNVYYNFKFHFFNPSYQVSSQYALLRLITSPLGLHISRLSKFSKIRQNNSRWDGDRPGCDVPF